MVEAEAQRIMDSRMPGFQSAYETQLAGLRKELAQAKADPDGAIQVDDSQLQQELAASRKEADALRAGRQFPDAYPVYEALMASQTAEEQLKLLQGFVRNEPIPPPGENPAPIPPTVAAGFTPAPIAPPAPIDPNNPPSTPAPGGGRPESLEAAEGIIDRFKTWPKFG